MDNVLVSSPIYSRSQPDMHTVCLSKLSTEAATPIQTLVYRTGRMSMHVVLASLLLAMIGCSSAAAPNPQPSPAVEKKAAAAPEKPAGNWVKDEKSNVMDNTKEITLVTSAVSDEGGTLLIRFRSEERRVGKECRSRW